MSGPPPFRYFPGDRFGRIVLVRRTSRVTGKRAHIWVASCDCGGQFETTTDGLKNGQVRSCGCLQRELAAQNHRKHGQGAHGQRTPEYKTWLRIKSRCSRPTDDDFKNYGARGITVCERWNASFEAFLSDMGRRPTSLHSIDRIDNDGPYSPENCQWTTNDVQAKNMRHVKRVCINGIMMVLCDADRALGITRGRISRLAIKRGLPPQHIADEIIASKLPNRGRNP